MRNFSSEEIEYTIASGLLHCGPSFRTCFSQSTKHFCFIQGNLQEYLAARWFVKRKEVPCRGNTSKMVMRFMAGILSEQNDQVFMEKILEGLVKDVKKDARIPLFIAQCLAEYQDKEFAQNFVRNGHLQSYLCSVCDDGISCMVEFGLLNFLSSLALVSNQITDAAVDTLCQVLQTPTCKVTALNLRGNQITDAGVVSLRQALQTPTCKVTALINLCDNWITDAGVVSLCQAIQTPTCNVTELHLSYNQITAAAVASLCQVIQTPTCKVTELYLSYNQITDAGVASLCQAMQAPTCKVTELYLSYNQITEPVHNTDFGVGSLCLAIQRPTCKVTTLDLNDNLITDAGAFSLCQASRHHHVK
ncbi:unnamed protein product [Pocillopora meandrina]|uniref:Uncharacterized protein n=1 Tax=Pocillopora meandrina TaxID=46732 RepID=A0AAU9X5I8_9CNID|nr:unnamed protein product [Pocillopora meandrina]